MKEFNLEEAKAGKLFVLEMEEQQELFVLIGKMIPIL